MSSKGDRLIPNIDLNVDAILNKADHSKDAITMQSSLSGTAYAIGKDGGILIMDSHNFFGASLDDMRVIHQEMEYVIEQAERWQRS